MKHNVTAVSSAMPVSRTEAVQSAHAVHVTDDRHERDQCADGAEQLARSSAASRPEIDRSSSAAPSSIITIVELIAGRPGGNHCVAFTALPNNSRSMPRSTFGDALEEEQQA